MNENIVEQKSFAFAVRIVNLYKYLSQEQKEYTLSKQLLRSGTSIGLTLLKHSVDKARLILQQKCVSR